MEQGVSERRQNWWNIAPGHKIKSVLRLRNQIQELQEEVARLKEMVVKDPLTGLINRKGLDDLAENYIGIWKRGMTEGLPLTLVVFVIDIDGFKSLNDIHDHQEGDRLLKEVGQAWQESLRKTDLVAILTKEGEYESRIEKAENGVVGRTGGDEFVLLAFTGSPESLKERLQGVFNRVIQEEFTNINKDVREKLGISVGWAEVGENLDGESRKKMSSEELFSKAKDLADQRMYEEKREKNAAR